MAKGSRSPKLACRLVPRPERCGGQKLAQVYRALVPAVEPAGEPPTTRKPLTKTSYETPVRPLC